MKRRYKMLLVAVVITIAVGIAGCGKKQQTPPPVVNTPADSQPVETPADVFTEEPKSTQTPTPSAEEPKTLVAKTYKEVYPYLYTFYPDNPTYKYSQWVYTIDGDSTFIGSITLPDGTVIVGGGDAGEGTNINIPGSDYTGGNKPAGNPNSGSVSDPGTTPGPGGNIVVGDPTVNPKGEDIDLTGDDGVVTKVTTKTIENAKIDNRKTTPFTVVFKADSVTYTFDTNTLTSVSEELLSGKLYKGLEGSVYLDESATIVTSGGTYQQYSIGDTSGAQKVYACVYVPKYAANTAYILTSSDIDSNANLMEVLQLLVVE